MNWLKNIFTTAEPTLEQVSAEQAKLAQRREAIRQRLSELETALVSAYGDETANVEAIHSEASRLERELSSLATVSAELEAERTAAVKRQILTDARAEYETLQAHTAAILELNPEIMRLRRELGALVQESNKHRQAVRGLRNAEHLRLTQRCWTAHRKAESNVIKVTITETKSDIELLKLAIERNNAHGLQLSREDKKREAIRLYAAGTGETKEEIARVLSISVRTVSGYLHDIDRQLREERKQKMFDMWLACHTQEEIADELSIERTSVARELQELCILENLPNSTKLSAQFQDDFTPPIYNVWSWSKKTNEVNHFGNSEQRALTFQSLYLSQRRRKLRFRNQQRARRLVAGWRIGQRFANPFALPYPLGNIGMGIAQLTPAPPSASSSSANPLPSRPSRQTRRSGWPIFRPNTNTTNAA